MRFRLHGHSGFTLVEMSIVLLILGFLLGGGLAVMSTQIENQRTKDTQKLLEDAKEALIGFAIANGRLPCPASAASNGVESPVGGGNCTNPFNGFLPAVTLGLSGVDANGYLPDGWSGIPNRIRYAVSNAVIAPAVTPAATTADGIKSATMASFLANTNHVWVCASSTGITANNCGAAAANRLTNNAAAVVFSLGKNAPTGGTGADEAANLNNDRVFVSHIPIGVGGTGGEFDDIVTWIPATVLFNRMIQAGRLP